jgi:hypothetical protein
VSVLPKGLISVAGKHTPHRKHAGFWQYIR